jgi:uncharacterized membrane protein
MSDLVAIAYDDVPTAQQVASNLGEAVKAHVIELEDLVIVERKADHGVDDDFMKRLGTELQPGKAALVLLVSKVSPDKILPEVKIPGTVIQTSLSSEGEAALQDALDKARAGAA